MFTQESNLPQHSFTDFTRQFDDKIYQPYLAAPCPIDPVLQRPQHKGVTTIAHRSLFLSQPNPDTFNEEITQLYTQGRFQHVLLHPGLGHNPISFINFYGYSTSNSVTAARNTNIAAMNSIIEYTHSLQNHPIFILGDFNHDPTNFANITNLAADNWADIVDTYSDPDNPSITPTFCRNSNLPTNQWNWQNASRLDTIFANALALPLA